MTTPITIKLQSLAPIRIGLVSAHYVILFVSSKILGILIDWLVTELKCSEAIMKVLLLISLDILGTRVGSI